jgi:hypothetical protein
MLIFACSGGNLFGSLIVQNPFVSLEKFQQHFINYFWQKCGIFRICKIKTFNMQCILFGIFLKHCYY